jgi:PIN domain nuclease of toxin-antitoxin system
LKALLDTHAILYLASAPERLGEAARAVIDERQNQLYASLASLWEIAIKVKFGKLELPSSPSEFWDQTLSRALLIEAPIGKEAILATLALPLEHRDPFDRLLAAQALALGMPFLSGDPEIDVLGVERIW